MPSLRTTEGEGSILRVPTGRAKNTEHVEQVFDLVNTGPLRQFVVRGADGRPFIVHNCENIVQALARIIVTEQMLVISRVHRIVMTTHDEGSWVTPAHKANATAAFVKKCMSVPPKWWPDIPVGASVSHDKFYCK